MSVRDASHDDILRIDFEAEARLEQHVVVADVVQVHTS